MCPLFHIGLSDGDIVEISGISSTNYKNIEGVRTIGLSTVTSGLSEAITKSCCYWNYNIYYILRSYAKRKFEVNDVIQINSEQFLVINHDDVNNKYRLRRGHNSTSPLHHILQEHLLLN